MFKINYVNSYTYVKSYLVKWKRDGDSKKESDAHELEVEWNCGRLFTQLIGETSTQNQRILKGD